MQHSNKDSVWKEIINIIFGITQKSIEIWDTATTVVFTGENKRL